MTDESVAATSAPKTKHSVLSSSFPVLLPEFQALFALAADFELQALSTRSSHATNEQSLQDITNELKTLDTQDEGCSAGPKEVSANNLKRSASFEADNPRPRKALFGDNKTFTENADITNVSSRNPLVDLFYDVGEDTRSPASKFEETLTQAWKEDALLTLKIIFNARSIHLGKSSRVAAYGAFGWLANHHPVTLLTNLQWLIRPVIGKKASKPEDGKDTTDDDDGFEMITAQDAATSSTEASNAYDVYHGVSHGYWKDLLNLIVFAAHDQLKLDGDFDSLLKQHPDKSKAGKRKRWDQDQEVARELRREKRKDQNKRVQEKLNCDPFYRALHVKVTQLFTEQLKVDKALLDSGKRADLRKLSLAAKWAPTFGEFHDKHTFILSSIAEVLFSDPALHCPDASNRELYLRHVRELFRKQYSSPLRKALRVVERDIAAETFDNIDYSHVPSIAMDRYTSLFIHKDNERFAKYIDDVSLGASTISGATLLPSTLVRKACETAPSGNTRRGTICRAQAGAMQKEIQRKVIDGQWRTLVESVRNAGVLQSSVAVCDVSGSMFGPKFNDGSTPLHSSIGLSLLISEVTSGPFGGSIITFSENPQVHDLRDAGRKPNGLCHIVEYVQRMGWGMNTNLVAVFEHLLENAKAIKVSQNEMVKQVFVFSDMQFDQGMDQAVWTSSFDRIKIAYADAGYDMPKLVFWNLAGATSKPVTVDDRNTALVSGYSQGMLKAFLETGALDGVEEVVEQAVKGEDGMVEVTKVEKIDPLTAVKKAVEHKAYSMLKVVD